eukprot:TRINITY_DN1158_c0_g1_i1.p1 TRINITY_DN1158_c0_g1~~TRINITY_DN1158_c0_g1_i1.p1  ORF type:complete len:216 (-),score=56.91 TRINITY_DN1158_c0_g1_i1:56-703(-)
MARQSPARAIILSSACLCLLLALRSIFAGEESQAWVALPGDALSRRSMVAGTAASSFAALLGGFAEAANAASAEDIRPGAVRPSGVSDYVDYEEGADPPEVVAQRWKNREEGEKQRAEYKASFRVVFGEFASEDSTMDTRLEKMADLQQMITKNKRLPLGITREDVVSGVRSVKYQLGCVKLEQRKGDCKRLESQFGKLMNTIDKNMYKGITSNR